MSIEEIKTDQRTGVPLNPEDILEQNMISSSKKLFLGIPRKIVIAGILFDLVIPIIGFIAGFFLFQSVTDGIILAAWSLGVCIFTGRVISWMIRP